MNLFLAAAKLANATRTQKHLSVTKMQNDRRHRPATKQSPLIKPLSSNLTSSIMNPMNCSLKTSASNGSGLENFSTDDAEEGSGTKMDSLNIFSSLNHNPPGQRMEISISQISLTISIDESRTLPISKSKKTKTKCHFSRTQTKINV